VKNAPLQNPYLDAVEHLRLAVSVMLRLLAFAICMSVTYDDYCLGVPISGTSTKNVCPWNIIQFFLT